jgi:hypothetical protein
MTVRLENVGVIHALAQQLEQIETMRESWRQVDLNTTETAVAINQIAVSSGHVPYLTDDTLMHQAIVQAVCAEYDRRASAVRGQLENMGVKV